MRGVFRDQKHVSKAQKNDSRVGITGYRRRETGVRPRKAGECRWETDYTTVAQTPGKPEKREYRALGLRRRRAVGQPSDIVTAIFGI